MMDIQLLYPFVTVGLLALITVALVWYFVKRSVPQLRYSLTAFLASHAVQKSTFPRHVLTVLKIGLLIFLALLAGRPQWVDSSQTLLVQGVDIILALDVSGSMRLYDDPRVRDNRLEAAKREARAFINKRTNDPIGLVLFAEAALFRLPLTLDKAILNEVVSGIELGDIPAQGTKLLTGLGLALNRLRTSDAESKVIILLTDGMPEGDSLDPDTLITLARKYNVKIYTIGVGRNEYAFDIDQYGRAVKMPTGIDSQLLTRLALETGGLFFRAHDNAEMKAAYEAIDTLEKSDREAPLFFHFYEFFSTWVVLLILAILISENLLRMFMWRGVWA